MNQRIEAVGTRTRAKNGVSVARVKTSVAKIRPKENRRRGDASERASERAYDVRTNDRLFGCITMYVLA